MELVCPGLGTPADIELLPLLLNLSSRTIVSRSNRLGKARSKSQVKADRGSQEQTGWDSEVEHAGGNHGLEGGFYAVKDEQETIKSQILDHA